MLLTQNSNLTNLTNLTYFLMEKNTMSKKNSNVAVISNDITSELVETVKNQIENGIGNNGNKPVIVNDIDDIVNNELNVDTMTEDQKIALFRSLSQKIDPMKIAEIEKKEKEEKSKLTLEKIDTLKKSIISIQSEISNLEKTYAGLTGKKLNSRSRKKNLDRKNRIESLILTGKLTRKQITETIMKEYPETVESTLKTILTDCKNPTYQMFDKLAYCDNNGIYSFVG